MPNKNIFCNAPWYELQIYWDGSLGFCCQESHKLYPNSDSSKYNIKNMTIAEWVNSAPMKQARLSMFQNNKNTICSRCYHEEEYSASSRRHRCNQKSVIFTKSNFNESYEQSPGYNKFEYSKNNLGVYTGMPVDLHIDLGNYCNLSCKMCKPEASSSIASQYVKWGITEASNYIGTDWTRDSEVWQRTIDEIADITELKNIHFMGGETLITSRFEEFIDFMISQKRYDVGFSFVTNGTIFNERLLDKLKKFRRVGIEISIETITEHNAYQRQGTDLNLVLDNINRYLEYCNGTNITLTVRPAISALTIGYYDTLLKYCYERKLIIKSLLVYKPAYLDVGILSDEVRYAYVEKYHRLLMELNLSTVDCHTDYNESDPNQIDKIIKTQIEQCLNLLQSPRVQNYDKLFTELVSWCKRWDNVHRYNALELYPELAKEFSQRGY